MLLCMLLVHMHLSANKDDDVMMMMIMMIMMTTMMVIGKSLRKQTNIKSTVWVQCKQQIQI